MKNLTGNLTLVELRMREVIASISAYGVTHSDILRREVIRGIRERVVPVVYTQVNLHVLIELKQESRALIAALTGDVL